MLLLSIFSKYLVACIISIHRIFMLRPELHLDLWQWAQSLQNVEGDKMLYVSR